jgi:hypothetical protein
MMSCSSLIKNKINCYKFAVNLPRSPVRKSYLNPVHYISFKQPHVDAHFWGHFGVVRGEGFDHSPVRCTAADAAEVRADCGFWHVSADVGSGIAADADLGGVVIAPESGALGTECTVAVVHIIGLARHCDAHSTAMASSTVKGGRLGGVRHGIQFIRTPAQRQAALAISAPTITITVWVGIKP